jgi:hypothetical protein
MKGRSRNSDAVGNPEHLGCWGLTAVGMRAAERAGHIQAPDDLKEKVAAVLVLFTDSEIDDAFDAFVDEYGRTAGATILLNDLNHEWRTELETQKLIIYSDGDVVLTTRGSELHSLLQQYGRSDRVWLSLVHDTDA